MKKALFLFVCALGAFILVSCEKPNKDNEPTQQENVQHGNIGDVISIGGYYYKITNNFLPYTVELERDGYTAPAGVPRRFIRSNAESGTAYEGDVVVPSKISYDGTDFAVTSIGEGAFYNKNVKSVYIPGTVEYIGFNAFRMCYNMEKITLMDGVKRIGSYAFSGCRKCTSIKIPDSVEELGECAFEECYQWTTVEIGSGMKRIGYGAFGRRNYPTAKSSVYCYAATPPEIVKKGNSCYAFNVTNCNLNVPKNSRQLYIYAPGWQSFSTIYGF